MNVKMQGSFSFIGVAMGFCVCVLLLFLPFISSDPVFMSIVITTLLFAAAALGWNIFSGFTGYISLGHASFYGLGAYILAILCQRWRIQTDFGPFVLLPIVGFLTAVCALPLGWVALRTRRHTFTIMTIAMFFILQYLSYNLRGLTNGSSGLTLPIPSWSADTFNRPFYFVALLLFLLALACSWWLYHSSYGLQLRAIRDDEDRALGLGVRANGAKLLAFVLSAVFVGMAGAVSAYFLGYISPNTAFDRSFNIAIVLLSALGGFTVPIGPVVGALLVIPLQQYITIQYGNSGISLILYGSFLLVVLLCLPHGIVPSLRKRWFTHANTEDIVVSDTPFVPSVKLQLPTTPPPLISPQFEKAVVQLKSVKPQAIVRVPPRYQGPMFVVHKTVTTKVKAQRLRPLESEMIISEMIER